MESKLLKRGTDAVEKGDEPPKATDAKSSGNALSCDSTLQTTAYPVHNGHEIEDEKEICPVQGRVFFTLDQIAVIWWGGEGMLNLLETLFFPCGNRILPIFFIQEPKT